MFFNKNIILNKIFFKLYNSFNSLNNLNRSSYRFLQTSWGFYIKDRFEDNTNILIGIKYL